MFLLSFCPPPYYQSLTPTGTPYILQGLDDLAFKHCILQSLATFSPCCSKHYIFFNPTQQYSFWFNQLLFFIPLISSTCLDSLLDRNSPNHVEWCATLNILPTSRGCQAARHYITVSLFSLFPPSLVDLSSLQIFSSSSLGLHFKLITLLPTSRTEAMRRECPFSSLYLLLTPISAFIVLRKCQTLDLYTGHHSLWQRLGIVPENLTQPLF